MIGELYATFVFDTPRLAQIGWERVAKRCGGISVNRWCPDGRREHAIAVTVLAEESERAAFERAKQLLANGTEKPTPAFVRDTLRAKRARVSASAPGRDVRRLVRDPLGRVVTGDGIEHGRIHRPQG